jgi:hypothetical protein
MPQDNSTGILTGLIFVALFLVMIASIHGATRFMDAAPAAACVPRCIVVRSASAP